MVYRISVFWIVPSPLYSLTYKERLLKRCSACYLFKIQSMYHSKKKKKGVDCTIFCFPLQMQLQQFLTNLCLLDDLECCLTLADLLQFPAEFNLMLGKTYWIPDNSTGSREKSSFIGSENVQLRKNAANARVGINLPTYWVAHHRELFIPICVDRN